MHICAYTMAWCVHTVYAWYAVYINTYTYNELSPNESLIKVDTCETDTVHMSVPAALQKCF